MAVHISDYLPQTYASLPLILGDVERDINSKGGRDMIHKELGPIFRYHQVDERFGLGLLHRHFDMSPDERLVAVGNVATPWDVSKVSQVGGTLRPIAWVFHGDQLIPYEFVFVGAGEAIGDMYPTPDYPVFLEALSARLKEIGVEGLLGLRVHPGPDFKGSVEFTVGRANITVAPSMVTIKHTVESVFFFDPGYIARGYAMKCDFGKCD